MFGLFKRLSYGTAACSLMGPVFGRSSFFPQYSKDPNPVEAAALPTIGAGTLIALSNKFAALATQPEIIGSATLAAILNVLVSKSFQASFVIGAGPALSISTLLVSSVGFALGQIFGELEERFERPRHQP